MLRIFFSLIILFSNFNFAIAEDFKLTKILEGLNSPWSLSFVSQNEVLITEKPGNIIYVNIENKKQKKVQHNLKVLEHGQGGLLDVLYHNKKVFISYSEKRKDFESSTSIAKGKYSDNKINFKNIFREQSRQ